MTHAPTDPFDIVRRLYRAVNESDLETIAGLHAADAVAEQVFDGTFVVEGREAIAAAYAAGPPHRTIEVRTIGGIETGWGWVQADWLEKGDGSHFRAGHSHFLIENARIRRHRRVVTAEGDSRERVELPPPGSRRYPARPIAGVGAVILIDGGRPTPGVVLIKRLHEPLAGHWSLPGGTLDLGETLESAVAREALEETGLIVDVGPIVDVFDRILLDEAGKVRYHFVLIDYLCRPIGGELRAGSDAADVAIAEPDELENYRLTGKAFDVIQKALMMSRERTERGDGAPRVSEPGGVQGTPPREK
ncbi:MAG: NUDIX hydrolase [Vicinamibacterales bacterium]